MGTGKLYLFTNTQINQYTYTPYLDLLLSWLQLGIRERSWLSP